MKKTVITILFLCIVGFYLNTAANAATVTFTKPTIKVDTNKEETAFSKKINQTREEIEQLVISLDLKEKVKFFGLRKDIGDLLQAVDIFVFPSIYEGLGISLIEAQISGLPCIVSNAIQDEAIITDNVIKLEITDKSAEEWVSNILNININDKNRVINIEDEKIKKFNVQEVCNRLEHIYLEDSNKQYQRKKITN